MVTPDKKMFTDANKFAYLVAAHPELGTVDLLRLVDSMGPLDRNNAMWYARELGYINKVKEDLREVDSFTVADLPTQWDLGEAVELLKGRLTYAFEQLSKAEAVCLDYYLTQWLDGYQAHDVTIALLELTRAKVLAELVVEVEEKDGPETYTFYTLYSDREKDWYRKEFNDEAIVTLKSADTAK